MLALTYSVVVLAVVSILFCHLIVVSYIHTSQSMVNILVCPKFTRCLRELDCYVICLCRHDPFSSSLIVPFLLVLPSCLDI